MEKHYIYYEETGFLWLRYLNLIAKQNSSNGTHYTISTASTTASAPYIVVEAADEDGPRPSYALTPQQLYELLEELQQEGRLVLLPPAALAGGPSCEREVGIVPTPRWRDHQLLREGLFAPAKKFGHQVYWRVV